MDFIYLFMYEHSAVALGQQTTPGREIVIYACLYFKTIFLGGFLSQSFRLNTVLNAIDIRE